MRVLIVTACFLLLCGFAKTQQLPVRASWQTVSGNTYENDMGQFTLTVPPVAHGWFVTDELMKDNPAIFGTLGVLGEDVVITIQRYSSANARQAADFLNSQFRSRFEEYKEISQESLKVDGKTTIALSFHASVKSGEAGRNEKEGFKMTVFLIDDPPKAGSLPEQFQGNVLGFTCEVPDKVAVQFDPIVRAVVTSFRHRTPK
jgi:hypothetical protein